MHHRLHVSAGASRICDHWLPEDRCPANEAGPEHGRLEVDPQLHTALADEGQCPVPSGMTGKCRKNEHFMVLGIWQVAASIQELQQFVAASNAALDMKVGPEKDADRPPIVSAITTVRHTGSNPSTHTTVVHCWPQTAAIHWS